MTVRLIKMFISMIVWVLDSLWDFVCRGLGITRPGRCVVLYYHAVPGDQIKRFAKQMDDLLRLAKPIALNGAVHLEADTRYAAVTFDDAFRDTIFSVLPEIEKRNIPITIFVPTGYLGKTPGWQMEDGIPDRSEVVMSADQLKEVGNNPLVTLGSHCVTHSSLAMVSSEVARREIEESKIELERITGKEVKNLSFPYGEFIQDHLSLASEAGYKRAFSIVPSRAFSQQAEFLSGRVRVDPTDWVLEYRLKFDGAYRWFIVALRIKNKLIGAIRNIGR